MRALVTGTSTGLGRAIAVALAREGYDLALTELSTEALKDTLAESDIKRRKAVAVGKPAPEGFLASASRLGVDPEEMYVVGDDLNNDVLAGQVVGMIGVLVRTGKFRQDTLDRWAADEFAMQPNHVIDSVADLPELLGL